jgi:hypothetical protein
MMKFSAHTIAGRTALAAALLAASAIAASPAQAQATGPTYSWKNVKVGGGGFVPGMIVHPLQRGLLQVHHHGRSQDLRHGLCRQARHHGRHLK